MYLFISNLENLANYLTIKLNFIYLQPFEFIQSFARNFLVWYRSHHYCSFDPASIWYICTIGWYFYLNVPNLGNLNPRGLKLQIDNIQLPLLTNSIVFMTHGCAYDSWKTSVICQYLNNYTASWFPFCNTMTTWASCTSVYLVYPCLWCQEPAQTTTNWTARHTLDMNRK